MSIDKVQLFENRKVRSVWDENVEKWWFSIVDVEKENETVTICNGFHKTKRGKFRRDDTLLIVDSNLRARNAIRSFQSPAGTTQFPSLRDISSLTQHSNI